MATDIAAILAAGGSTPYAFTEGTEGSSIQDGGHDMYDSGNQIQIQSVDPTSGLSTMSAILVYNNDCDGTAPLTVAGTDITYSTCKYEGDATFWAAKFFSGALIFKCLRLPTQDTSSLVATRCLANCCPHVCSSHRRPFHHRVLGDWQPRGRRTGRRAITGPRG